MSQLNTFTPGSLQKNVAAAGTEEALSSSSLQAYGVIIKAKHANTGMIFVGKNPVTSTTGYVLDGGETVALPGVVDLSKVYIDSGTNGDGVSVIYFTKDN
jgi:hypothetical protein